MTVDPSFVYKILGDISNNCSKAKVNEYKCHKLAIRCQAYQSYIDKRGGDLSDLPFFKPLISTLQECNKIAIKSSTSGWFSRIFRNKSDSEIIEDLLTTLDKWLADIKEQYSEFHSPLPEKNKDDNDAADYAKLMNDMERHTARIGRVIHQDVVDLRMIDHQYIQRGSLINDTFEYYRVYDGMFINKRVIIKELLQMNIKDIEHVKKGVYINMCLQDCEYIQPIIGAYRMTNLCVVYEHDAGSTFDQMISYDLKDKFVLPILRKIASALDYIHGANVIHKDVRSHNIVITDQMEPKLTNFDMSREITDDTHRWQHIDPIVKHWWSPERIDGYKSSTASDMYAFGMLMIEIVTRTTPPDLSLKRTDRFDRLIKSCISREKDERKTAIELMNMIVEEESSSVSV